jgi:cysteine-rich repeat protein
VGCSLVNAPEDLTSTGIGASGGGAGVGGAGAEAGTGATGASSGGGGSGAQGGTGGEGGSPIGCGDGAIGGSEACDDGNTSAGDGCSAACTEEPGWQCAGQPSVCHTTSGDGIAAGAEQCDHGASNGVSPDGCRQNCTLTTCGDGYVGGTESCDGGLQTGQDCTDAGFSGGTLACTNSCDFDTSGCFLCGDGSCSTALGETAANCPADCTGCSTNPQWQAVSCSTSTWVWSRDKAIATDLQTANANHVLATYVGGDAQNQALCSLDGTGWISTATFVMAGCNTSWYHIGGSYTGDCVGHDGEIWRHLVLGANDCFVY